MRFLLVGDTHAEYINLINKYVKKAEEIVAIDYVIQVGDFGFYPNTRNWLRLSRGYDSFDKKTLIIKGNHEDEVEIRKIEAGWRSANNMFYLHDGQIVRLDNEITILAHGGGFTPLTAVQVGTIPWNEADCDITIKKWKEAGSPKINILVTHEAPNGVGPIGSTTFGNPWTAGSKGIRNLWQTVKPKLMICGHYHLSHDYYEGFLHLRILEEAKNSATIYDTETGEFARIVLDNVMV